MYLNADATFVWARGASARWRPICRRGSSSATRRRGRVSSTRISPMPLFATPPRKPPPPSPQSPRPRLLLQGALFSAPRLLCRRQAKRSGGWVGAKHKEAVQSLLQWTRAATKQSLVDPQTCCKCCKASPTLRDTNQPQGLGEGQRQGQGGHRRMHSPPPALRGGLFADETCVSAASPGKG